MKRTNLKPIIIGISLAIITVCALFGVALLSISGYLPLKSFPTAIITKIAFQTSTEFIKSTEISSSEENIVDASEIKTGKFVQITGTGGVGLRIRQSPGIDSSPQFIAMENEIFEVKDGPVVTNDITWWFIIASYDNNRKGWAASQYLTVFNYP